MGTTEWVKGLPEKLPEILAVAKEIIPEKVKEIHVLAVDDSFVDRKVIERLLEISACKVTLVESAKSALQFLGLGGEDDSSAETDFQNTDVNLIITDYSMPGMTGYELLKKIKESSALKEIPVVIMSSENILSRIDKCLEEGAKEFLLKPVKLQDVKRLMEFMLSGKWVEQEQSSSSPLSTPDGDATSSSSPSPPEYSLPPLKRQHCKIS